MRIGIDARYAIHRSGFGNYAVGTVTALAAIDLHNDYFIYLDKRALDNQEIREHFRQLGSNFNVRYLPCASPLVYEHYALAHAAIKDRLDVLHCLFNVAPFWLPARIKLVLTLHDAIFSLGKKCIPRDANLRSNMMRLYYRWLAPYSAHRASIVFTDSVHSKRDLIIKLKICPEKIRVIYLAPQAEFSRPISSECNALLGRFGIKSPYILGYGSTEPRKNTLTLLQAYSLLSKRDNFHHKLVLVGARTVAWAASGLARYSREVGIEKDVFPLGPISAEDLKIIYSMADVFVNTTLYEGFCLPVLEAMACGAPVVCSNAASVPEIVGNAAITIDPRDPGMIARAIACLLSRPEYAQELALRGKQRAETFSWISSAAKVLSYYQTLAKDAP